MNTAPAQSMQILHRHACKALQTDSTNTAPVLRGATQPPPVTNSAQISAKVLDLLQIWTSAHHHELFLKCASWNVGSMTGKLKCYTYCLEKLAYAMHR